jgi:hypothetical protein
VIETPRFAVPTRRSMTAAASIIGAGGRFAARGAVGAARSVTAPTRTRGLDPV